MSQPIMNALDAIAGSQASAYITMADGNRYCFMQLYSFESSMEINVAEVPILGKSGKGNKPTGWSGTWSGTAYYNQSIIRKMLLEYKKTGFMPTFDIQVSNEDPTACGAADDYPEKLPDEGRYSRQVRRRFRDAGRRARGHLRRLGDARDL